MSESTKLRRYTERSAVVAGSSALRAVIAQRLLDEGANVVSSNSSAVALVDRCLSEFGSVDVLVNAPDVWASTPAHEQSEADWDRVVDGNITATYLACKAVLGHMVAARRGSILNVLSTAAFVASSTRPSYDASMSGLVGITKQIALDYGRYGIRCNAICVGPTAGSEEPTDALISSVALRRVGDPSEIAAAAAFIASDRASYVTGAALVVDGGQSIYTGASQ
jgi:NAD(P)-dependent dehydrogenase (short-subunit alcohol dehydrogenase family)